MFSVTQQDVGLASRLERCTRAPGAMDDCDPAAGSRSTPDPFLCCFFSRDESEAYLAGLGTVGLEVFEQVPKLDAVVVPAAGQYGLLASTAAAIKHLNSRILVIVSGIRQRVKTRQNLLVFIIIYFYVWPAASAIFNVFVSQILCFCLYCTAVFHTSVLNYIRKRLKVFNFFFFQSYFTPCKSTF